MEHKIAFHMNYGDVLFFPQWILYGKKETFMTCILLGLFGIFFQFLKFARTQYARKSQNLEECRRPMLTKVHLLQTLLYVIQFIWGYIIMLTVMSYNILLMASALIGFGLGYFLFGWGEYEDPRHLKIKRPKLPRRFSLASIGMASQVRRFSLGSFNMIAPSSTTQELLKREEEEADTNIDGSCCKEFKDDEC